MKKRNLVILLMSLLLLTSCLNGEETTQDINRLPDENELNNIFPEVENAIPKDDNVIITDSDIIEEI